MRNIYLAIFLLALSYQLKAQEAEETKHYMPLYIDIPTEINVQKGYKEMDIGAGYTSYDNYNAYKLLAEYDFSPVRHLGFEIEAPLNLIHTRVHDNPDEETEAHNIAGLRIGVVYSFLNLKQYKLSFAGGYYNEFESRPIDHKTEDKFIAGNIYNPFLTVAKVWGKRLHTMVYSGPMIKQEFKDKNWSTSWKINTTLAYQIGQKERDNFVGIEINQSLSGNTGSDFETILRPQFQLSFCKQFSMGLVGTFPIDIHSMNNGGFLRLIYMP